MSQIENFENSNGLILKANYIPEELLIKILSYVDCVQLVLCHLVCKRWNNLIKENVWRRKANIACGQVLFTDEKTPWNTYFSICNKILFKRNLLTSTDVQIFCDNNKLEVIQINVKDPPVNILPLPEDLLFKENIHCIKITDNNVFSVHRKFIVDLIKEGFTDYILDNFQPTIEISDWYYTTLEVEKAEYECSIKLLNDNDFADTRVMRVYHFHKNMKSINRRGKWFKFSHVFKNYGPGLRLIKFTHGGHSNIIMAEASVVINVPSRKKVPA